MKTSTMNTARLPKLMAGVLSLTCYSFLSGNIALAQEPVQHGAQPNPGEVRPPSPQGNAPSPAAGTLLSDRSGHRLFGLPAGLAIGLAVLVVVVAGLWAYSRRPRAGQRGTGPERHGVR